MSPKHVLTLTTLLETLSCNIHESEVIAVTELIVIFKYVARPNEYQSEWDGGGGGTRNVGRST